MFTYTHSSTLEYARVLHLRGACNSFLSSFLCALLLSFFALWRTFCLNFFCTVAAASVFCNMLQLFNYPACTSYSYYPLAPVAVAPRSLHIEIFLRVSDIVGSVLVARTVLVAGLTGVSGCTQSVCVCAWSLCASVYV